MTNRFETDTVDVKVTFRVKMAKVGTAIPEPLAKFAEGEGAATEFVRHGLLGIGLDKQSRIFGVGYDVRLVFPKAKRTRKAKPKPPGGKS